MNNLWAFLPMRASTELLGDRESLRARLEDDSYLYFPGLLDRDRVLRLRRRILEVLAEVGWVEPAVLMRGRTVVRPVREGEPEFFAAYDEIQKLEELHELAHDDALVSAMRDVVGDRAFPHPLKIARLVFPGHYEVSTPPHQDYPNNQGTPNLTASWIPVGDVPFELGGLAILRGSHRFGVLPLARHLGPGNRQALLSQEMLERCRWVTTEFAVGDVLVFGSQTVHASLHNASEFYLRLSVDYRWQDEGEALTAACLEPHFGRLTWEQIYAGWRSRAHQYYWRDLAYETVPFRELQLVGAGEEASREEVAELLAYERRRDARHARTRREPR